MNEFTYYLEMYLEAREALQCGQVSHGLNYEDALEQIEFGKKGMEDVFDEIERSTG